jgi:hypothetical protein
MKMMKKKQWQMIKAGSEVTTTRQKKGGGGRKWASRQTAKTWREGRAEAAVPRDSPSRRVTPSRPAAEWSPAA